MAAIDPNLQWYQTDSTVYVSLLRKGVDPKAVQVDFKENSATTSINGEVAYNINLSHPINPTSSTFKCTPMKIELKLAKTEGVHWNCLEGIDPAASLRVIDNPVPAPTEGDRPNPLRPTRNWDAIAKEADSIEEGDPLQNLFSKIYKDASEDTRKAMEKSFVESNGTVLSTNWSEVSRGKVEMKPPDGMEFKEYPK